MFSSGWFRRWTRPNRPEGGSRSRVGSGLIQDLRFGVRSFRRTPGFTLMAIVTLTLGIAGTTAVFSVADAVLLRPLSLPDSNRLVSIWVTRPATDEWKGVAAGATYLDWAAEAHSFASMAAYRGIDFNLTGGGLPERVRGASVTSSFFSVLGVSPALGRLPEPGDDRTEASRTVVISDAFWRSRYGADRNILERTLILNGEPYRVVAVLPAGITFPRHAMLYVPSPYRVPLTPLDREDMSAERSAGYLSVVARLRPGVSIDQARAEMKTIAARMAVDYPETKKGEGASVVSLKNDLVGDLRPMILMLLGAVGLVLLIACANVANLLTIRASRRQRELAIRISIGAGLSRIRRQLLTESVVLAIAGGVPGFLLAIWGTRALVALAPEGIPRLAEVSVDQRVFLFSIVATLASGLLFGLAPMLGLSDRTAALTLKGTPEATRVGAGRLRDAVVVAEIALTLLLVNTAGLMVRTFRDLNGASPGFDPSGVLVAHVSLPESKYGESEAQSAFYERALEKIRALPGVESAATILTLPMHWALRGTLRFLVQGVPSDQQKDFIAGYQVASPDYFRTMRIPLLRGRAIEPTDRLDTGTVAVINEAMARRYWPTDDPLGKKITFWGDPDDPKTEWATIVGVVGNVATDGLDEPAKPQAYIPVSQAGMPRSTFVIRTSGDPRSMAATVRKAIEDVDPALPLYGVTTLDDVVVQSLGQRRFRMLLLAIFAGMAIVLATLGLYGLIAFSVSRQTREIGIRMALGARQTTIVGHIVRQGFLRVLIGLALGLLGTVVMSKLVASQVFGVSVTDPANYAGSVLLLFVVALAGSIAPALRAARVSPVAAVRVE